MSDFCSCETEINYEENVFENKCISKIKMPIFLRDTNISTAWHIINDLSERAE